MTIKLELYINLYVTPCCFNTFSNIQCFRVPFSHNTAVYEGRTNKWLLVRFTSAFIRPSERWRKLTWVNRLSPVQKEEGCELGAGVPFGALGKQSSIKF
ncbi:hypothetical protein DPMN_126465 [Dreissena polymorpha]|uniref:Uncharacterized protein n=1 Tax=Dreissena polymorpha TaxID=45954 RepID=A0A9D4JY58_DREPO|nr:hypothetical protein DPMN_126465 [Dreissena polymorpha]